MSRSFASLASIAAISLIAAVQPASAATFNVDGAGSRRCSTIVADFNDRPTAATNDMMGWAYGYMTRRNMERAAAGMTQIQLQSKNFNAADMVTLMLKFCDKNPDVRYYQAVDALFEVLARDQGLTS
jgi:hypothetical protein